jgi:hypothetical protein
MGHKSLETTMRYLVPATDVHRKLDQVRIRGQLKNSPVPRKSVTRETASPRSGGLVQSTAGEG